MEEFLEDNIDNYIFEKNTFSKKVNKLWIFFNRNGKGLRDTYLFLRILQQEKNGDDFDNFFPCSVNEISYRSLLCKSQVKKYIRSLIHMGLVERKIERKVEDEDNKKVFKSNSLYRVKKLTNETIACTSKRLDSGVISIYFDKYREIKVR